MDILMVSSPWIYHDSFNFSTNFILVLHLLIFLLLCLEHLDPINVKIAELREALESIITEQKYLKARDARHRNSK